MEESFTGESRSDYEKPLLVDYGDLVELTAQGSDGESLDADFPAATKKSALTFS